ncbi:short chain dehydrogenase [Nostoc sp. 'Peltigera membranacea cyanobiont' 210A]|uniref:SDR family oxidoreductase n=1 Tax=Nostoc sp. 'Peltigera membranacea cyanobiont' 210A TaxID=2014529 RepID=UPI000B95A9D7|nr:SDR family oxidoreductase [Nostoc sp. 'Peltigera membranacea cyanobiont' 210A]OYD96585.1 short chain dehydrogenase [Nostoc sp. 'Peltigera membranacea cyanobiont' 210A]
MTGQLDGKVALVTGASSGIGRASAIAFASAGAKVVLASRRLAESEETVRLIKETGGEAIFVKTDVSNAAEVEALVNTTVKIYGRLDCACNNAGIGGNPGLITDDMSEEDWDRLVKVNLKGTWLCLKYEIRAMLKQNSGAIVNVASAAGVVGIAGIANYSATKGGVIALTRALAMDYAKEGIRINVVSPGVIETDILSALSRDALAQLKAMHPIGRIGKPEEVAETVVWLCSEATSFITGHNMIIDGGYTAQ